MKVTNFVVYDATGRILRAGTCSPDDVIHQAVDGGEWVLATDDLIDPGAARVVDGALAARAPSSISASASGRAVTIVGIPVGLRVYVNGPAFASPIADDPSGAIAITVPQAGTYRFAIDAFPLAPWSQSFQIP